MITPHDDQTKPNIPAHLEGLGKLGLGELANKTTQQWVVRTMFFGVAREQACREIEAFHAELGPLFQDFRTTCEHNVPRKVRGEIPEAVIVTETTESISRSLLLVRDWNSLSRAAQQYPSANTLRQSLHDWAIKRGLAADWFLDAAYLMLCVASVDEPNPWSYPGSMMIGNDGVRYGSPAGSHWVTMNSSLPIPSLPRYNPAAQSRADYIQAVHKKADAYCASVEAEFKEAGFAPSIRKRQRSGPVWMDVEWFVLSRMVGLTHKQIAERFRVTEDVVSKATRKVAQQLGLTNDSKPTR